MLNGILIVDKPSEWTSFDVIAKLRGVLKTKKIGHSGTLDPLATGVLPLFIGPCVKAVDMQQNHNKKYTATILFGKKTDTGDITGTVLQECNKIISEQDLLSVLPSFSGKSQQVPPMYSAIKINGQPLYKLARQGIEVERKPRDIEILEIDYISGVAQNEFVISVKCTKGTYIRVLLEDIAVKLGTVATMTNLRRTESGNYSLSHAKTLQEIYDAVEQNSFDNLIVSVDTIFTHMPRVDVTVAFKDRLYNGASISYQVPDGDYRAYCNNEFFGYFTVTDNCAKVGKLFVERQGMK